MRRHQFETYLDKVFDWTASVATMAEGRHNPPHPWPKVFDAVFLGSACQFGPVHRIEAECKDGVLHSDWARGRVVAAVDGIEICSSYCRGCQACLERTVQRKVDGQLEKWTQYYHRLSAVTVVSTPFPVFLGVRFQKSGETEVAC